MPTARRLWNQPPPEAFNKPVTRAKSRALVLRAAAVPRHRRPASRRTRRRRGGDIRAPADAAVAVARHARDQPAPGGARFDGEGGAAAAFVDVARIGAAVETIGRTVIICPGDHPVMPFGRSWCLYEIASTPDAALEVRIGWGSWASPTTSGCARRRARRHKGRDLLRRRQGDDRQARRGEAAAAASAPVRAEDRHRLPQGDRRRWLAATSRRRASASSTTSGSSGCGRRSERSGAVLA